MESSSAPSGEMGSGSGTPSGFQSSVVAPPVKASPPPAAQLANSPHEDQSGECGRRPRPGPAVVAGHRERGTSTTVRRRIRSGAHAVVDCPPGLAPGLRRSTLQPEIVGMAWVALVPRVPRPGAISRLSADIQSVFVMPEWRGQGIGTALVEAASEHATHLGSVRVTVHSGRKAVPLYERMGFESSRRLLLRPTD